MAQENITYQMHWMGPSTIIPNMNLEDGRNMRDVLCRGDICYIQYRRSIHEDLHQVFVSRDRALLEDPLHSRMIYLTQEQFTQLIPWDRSLEYCDTSELLEQIRAHAALVLGDSGLNEDSRQRQATPTISQKRFNPRGLRPLFIPYETLTKTYQSMESQDVGAENSKRGRWAWLQMGLLRAALLAIQASRNRPRFPYWARKLEKLIKRILEEPRQILARLVAARPAFRGDELCGCLLQTDMLFALFHEKH